MLDVHEVGYIGEWEINSASVFVFSKISASQLLAFDI